MDAKLSQLQMLALRETEKIVEYNNRLRKLVNDVQDWGRTLSRAKQNHALLRGMPKSFDLTKKSTINNGCDYHSSVAKLIVRETRLQEICSVSYQTVVTNTAKEARKILYLRESRPPGEDCWPLEKDKKVVILKIRGIASGAVQSNALLKTVLRRMKR